MIHDIDLILSLVNSSVDSVSAFGWNALGETEDFATACLRFRNGAVANLRASRISPTPKRSMQLHTDDGFVEIDFASNLVSHTCAVEEVASGARQADQLPPDQRAKVKESLFTEWLSKVDTKAAPVNAIEQEHLEFISAVQSGSKVTVTGEQGYHALEVAARILDQIAMNRPSRSVIPAAARFGKTKAA